MASRNDLEEAIVDEEVENALLVVDEKDKVGLIEFVIGGVCRLDGARPVPL